MQDLYIRTIIEALWKVCGLENASSCGPLSHISQWPLWARLAVCVCVCDVVGVPVVEECKRWEVRGLTDQCYVNFTQTFDKHFSVGR